MSTPLPPSGELDKRIGAFNAPLAVSAQDFPNMTVQVRAGSYFNGNGDYTMCGGGSSPLITTAVSFPKWVMITLTSTGAIHSTEGIEAASPSFPAVAAGDLPLAAVYVPVAAVKVTPSMIVDVRPFLRVMDIVPDLAAQLADRPTTTDLNNGLALKANIDSPVLTGVPSAPTALPGNNTTQLATTEFVTAAMSVGNVISFNTRTGAIVLMSSDVTTALGFTPLAPAAIGVSVEAYDATILKSTAIGVSVEAFDTTILKTANIGGSVQANLGFTPYNATNPASYITSAGAPVQSFNTRTGPITLVSGDVTSALGFTPYDSTNPAAYITTVTSLDVTTALGFTPGVGTLTTVTSTGSTITITPAGATVNVDLPAVGTAGTYTKVTTDAQGRVSSGTSLGSSDVTTALGFTPIATTAIGSTVEAYDATILKSADIGSTVEGYDATILKSANIGSTVEGYDATILKSADIGGSVQANLGFTPYDSTNPSGYQTAAQVAADVSAALTPYATLASPTFTGVPELPTYTTTTLPPIAVSGIIYVSDANGGVGTIAFCNISGWIDIKTGTAVMV